MNDTFASAVDSGVHHLVELTTSMKPQVLHDEVMCFVNCQRARSCVYVGQAPRIHDAQSAPVGFVTPQRLTCLRLSLSARFLLT